jgi:glycerol-3-phosphate dehydrogenase (NAD(P)+)
VLHPAPIMTTTAVIGTGAWGTALASILARTGRPTILWGRDADKVAGLITTRRHPQLPALEIPAALTITARTSDLAHSDVLLWAVPTQATRALLTQLTPHFPRSAVFISLSKGLEENTLARVSTLLHTATARPVAVLSGPSMAEECMRGQPFCLVVAGDNAATQLIVERLHSSRCRLYTSPDVIGVEIGGALKNVIAIAAGICDGLRLGDNAKAAIITRGLAEMRRLGRALGAQDVTFAGMAGIGDLLTSCYSPLGRNRSFGQAIAAGENPQKLLAARATVAEGAWTCRVATELAARHHVELPIASQVANVIWGATPVPIAMENLLSRTPKEEDA